MQRYAIILTDFMELRTIFYMSDRLDDIYEVYYDNVDKYESEGLYMKIYEMK